MSQDEIVFEEIRYREPVRMRRPDGDRRWACLAYEVPGPDDLPVFLDRATADAIERHALSDTNVELGGILLGKECVDDLTGQPFVWVTKSLEAKHYENTQASFTYTHDSWEEITRERDRLHPDLDIVGWYHTHPDFGVFLSSHDLFIQHHFFAQPLQVAYVVDPIRQTRGFFRWRNGVMEQTGGFFLTAERGERVALARLVNDLENLPDADPTGGGGGLSPRLEAELIAMLSRPATQHHGATTAADRTQTALIFSVLGAMCGVLGVALVVWLNTLTGQVQVQADVLKEVRDTVRETSDRQRVALDALIGEAGGSDPDKFLSRYARAARERDEAKTRLANEGVTNNLLAAKVRELSDDFSRLRKKYEEASLFEKDAKEATDLRTRVDELIATSQGQTRKITDLEDLLDNAEGRKASALVQRYQKTWYAAAAGWTVSLVLALALAGGYFYYRFPPDDETGSGTGPGPAFGPTDPPPHQIL